VRECSVLPMLAGITEESGGYEWESTGAPGLSREVVSDYGLGVDVRRNV
jgi:hypothetical protein